MPSVMSLFTKRAINGVALNAFYLGILQAFNMLLPLLTIPYLVRVLGPSSFGVLAYSQVVFMYLLTICDYGFNLSSTRLIAINKNNSTRIQEILSSVIGVKISLFVIVTIITLPLVYYFVNDALQLRLYLWSFVFLFFQTLFPIFYFQGIEDMKPIVFINAFVRILSTIFILLFIKSEYDLPFVIIANSLGAFLASFAAYILILGKRGVRLIVPKYSSMLEQLKEGFDVFISNFLGSILANGGLFVLGIYQSASTVGYYSAIDKIVKAGMSMYQPISQALFPFISSLFNQNKENGTKTLIRIGLVVSVVLFVGIIILCFTSNSLLVFIYGTGYEELGYILVCLACWAAFSIINNIIGIQFLIGSGKSDIYRKAFVLAALLMGSLFWVIKLYSINGLLFITVMGEVFLTIIMILFIKKSVYRL
jgi:PST family polysaccharide transporter